MPGRRPDAGPFVKPGDNVPLGILWMVAATVLLALAAAIAKWQAAIYPVGEIMAMMATPNNAELRRSKISLGSCASCSFIGRSTPLFPRLGASCRY